MSPEERSTLSRLAVRIYMLAATIGGRNESSRPSPMHVIEFNAIRGTTETKRQDDGFGARQE